jgi:hypothetical protein
MKKLPLFFCCLLFACSSKKIAINNQTTFDKHKQPYYVSLVGKWNNVYAIYTLVDARETYFSIKAPVVKRLKRGDIYIP